MLGRARAFFADRGLLEVDTPAINRYAASDPYIDGQRVMTRDGGERFLQTSPESFMKRLLADGYPDIYSICKAFREGESGKMHRPEFTIVEWYRHGFALDEMIDDTVTFIATVLGLPDLSDPEVYEYATAFEEFAGINPMTAFTDELADAADADAALRESLGQQRIAWLDLLLGTRVATGFQAGKLTVIRHYPANQAALARLCPDNANVADRFEVFYGSIELANGYVELTDAEEQRQRIESDLDRRRVSKRPQVPVDEALLAALSHGLPECAGVAVGFERLLMIAADKTDIRDVVTFAHDGEADFRDD